MRSIALALLLCGCVSVPLARPAIDQQVKVLQPPAGTAAVFIYRPSAVMAGTGVMLGVLLDEARVSRLAPGSFAVVHVRPGEHKLVVVASALAERSFVAEAGRRYYFRAEPAFQWSGGPGVELVQVLEEQKARDELAACALVADPAGESLRQGAAAISKVNLRALSEETLLAAAVQGLDRAAGDGLPASPDVAAALLRLRTVKPALDDQQLVALGARAMEVATQALQSGEVPPAPLSGSRPTGLAFRAGAGPARLVSVVPGSGAAAVGLSAGLEVRSVAGAPVTGAAGTALQGLAGPAGSEVHLGVGRPGEPERDVVVRRGADDPAAVACATLGGKVLYLRPAGLVPAAARRVRDLGRAAGWPAPPVILDLRGVTGGLLEGAQELGDTFVVEGPLFGLASSRDPSIDRSFRAEPGTSPLEQARLVVLVDGGTGGAAELLAASLQDARRAGLRGGTTAGAFIVHRAFGFGGERQLIPIAALVRSGGQSLQGGVAPDVADDGQSPGPSPALLAAPCAGDDAPAATAADPVLQRAAAGLLAGG